jgi:hypothetical protein
MARGKTETLHQEQMSRPKKMIHLQWVESIQKSRDFERGYKNPMHFVGKRNFLELVWIVLTDSGHSNCNQGVPEPNHYCNTHDQKDNDKQVVA